MKKETLKKRTKIANNIMYYIYTHIDTDIDIEELSIDLKVSKFHMHRIFKEAFGRNIYESIKSIRLQKASNLLLTNKSSTISNIANICGYSSQSSFIKIFKERFDQTPKQWRTGGYKEYSQKILKQSSVARNSTADFSNIRPTIVKMPALKSFYIRNRGYNVNITNTWQKEELEPYKYFIKNGLVDMIMSAHVVNRNLDYSLPATLTWNINTTLLRKELGYKGVLISDDLQMYAISKHYSLDDTVRLAINSGVDILMYANQLAKPLKLETVIDSIYKQVRSGEIKMHRIKEANKRIDTLKKSL